MNGNFGVEKSIGNKSHIKPLLIAKFATPPYAGCESHVDVLASSLAPDIHPTVLAADISNRKIEYKKNYNLITVPSYGKIASAFLSPGVYFYGLSLLRKGDCNLLHLHSPNPWGDFLALSKLDVPVVITWHSDIVSQKHLYYIYKYFQKKVIDRSQMILVTTPFFLNSSIQLACDTLRRKIEYCPLGIDFNKLDKAELNLDLIENISQFAKGRPTALAVGRHVPYKGYEGLLHALELCKSKTCLVMVGNGPLTPVYKKIVFAKNLEDRVLFLQNVDEILIATAFKSCDFFIMPSILPSEAFGIASAEAMACGKPTIVCNLNNGVNYLNKDGITSIVVEPNDILGLANAIDRLSNDGNLRKELGRNAYSWVRSEFSIEKMREKIISVYSRVF